MASIPLALSIHNFINKVGADAGFASIIGLAILVLLYFAQARETATLREQAAEAAERIQQLEGRISQILRGQSASAAARPPGAQPARTATGSIVASRDAGVGVGARPAAGAGAGVGRGLPAAPAGVGAPALSAATKLIPTPGAGAPVALEEPPSGAATAPATVAGAGNGHSQESAAVVPVPSGPAGPPPRVQIRPGPAPLPSPRRPAGVPRTPTGNKRAIPSRGILAAAVGALVVAAVVIGLFALTSGGSSTKAKTGVGPVSNAPARTRHARSAGVNPANVTVAVLNGTATAQLANRVGVLLSTAGYKHGTITNAPDQTHTASVVAYLPGFRRDALAVAKSLKLQTSSVQAVDPNTQAVACPAAPAPCSANVVVTAGADLAGTQ